MLKVIASHRAGAVFGLVFALFGLSSANIYTVTNTADSGAGSLRQAIDDANANPGADVIAFNVAGSAPYTIVSNSDLIVTDSVTIDGTTQPGYAGSPLIELMAPAPLSTTFGFKLNASNCRVSGLSICLFGHGIYSSGFSNQVITKNYFGLRADGITAAGNVQRGVYLVNCTNSVIGRSGEGNVASGNANATGIGMLGGSGNQIAGNIAGPDATGTLPVRNKRGIELTSVVDSVVGGYGAGDGNQASANTETGIYLSSCQRVTIAGNLIGPQKNGVGTFTPPPNLNNGEQFGVQAIGCTDIVLGAAGQGWGNTLADCGQSVHFQNCTRGLIQNNIFGADPTGLINVRLNQGCEIDITTDLKVGGTAPFTANRFVNVQSQDVNCFNSQRTVFQGNVFGLKADNTPAANTNIGITLSGATNTIIGGANPGEGNLFGGLPGGGIRCSFGAHGTVIKGNLIGTDPTGTIAKGSSFGPGINLNNSNNCVIGGLNPGEGNLIVAQSQWGILIGDSQACTGTQILGNRIGIGLLNPSQALPNLRGGIDVANGTGNRISQNLIAFNAASGGYPGLGIDFDGATLTPNDVGDADTGPNNLQNYPVLTTAKNVVGGIHIQGTLNSEFSKTYTIELFKDDGADASLYGEGQYYLGSTTVTTDPSGNAAFDVVMPGSLVAGNAVAATATDPDGNTSQFSLALAAQFNRAPVANAGPDQAIAVPHDGDAGTNTASFTLDGSSSSDPDNDSLTYQWQLGATVVGTTAQLPQNQPAGTYIYTLTVTDPGGLSNNDTVLVTVTAETNQAPVSNPSPVANTQVPHDGDPGTNTVSVTLTGSGTDPDGDPLTYMWFNSFGTVANSPTVTLSLTPGTYSYTLLVTDPYGATNKKSISFTISAEPNGAPAANAGLDQSVAVQHDGTPATNTASFTLTGAASSDPNNDPLTYTWQLGATTVGTGVSLPQTMSSGTYTYTLIVSDPYGASSSDSVIVKVNPEPNAAPLTVVGPDQTVQVAHSGNPADNSTSVTVSGSATDPDGDNVTFVWTDENNNVLGTSPTLTTSLSVGSHTLKLRATDPYGASSSASMHVTVQAQANAAPLTIVGPDRTAQVAHDGDPNTNTASVTVSGSATDPDNDTVTYKWTDENNNVLGASASLTTSLAVGSHTLTLTGTDPYGASSSANVHVTITAEANSAPVSIVGPDHIVTTQPGDLTVAVVLDGSTSIDPDTDPLTYSWSDGVSVIGTSPVLSVVKAAGTYAFTLTVTDPYGATSSATVNITVKLGNRPPVAVVGPDITATVQHDGDPNTNTAAVTLDGSGSNDPDAGQALTYQWTDQNNAPAGNTAQITVNLMPGAYTFALTVTDPFGASSSSTIHVTVYPEPNSPPLVSGGTDMAGVADSNGQASFTLNATASDPDNDPVAIKWFEGAAQIGTGATLNVMLTAGTHILTVTATDPYGATSTDTVVVTVQYQGTFFLQPINNDGSSIFKLGSTVPVKFELTGASAGATNVVARLYIAKVTNDVIGTEEEPISTSTADTGNQFRYSNGAYIFNMSTKNLTAGTYQIRADLGDGAIHTVLVSLRS